MRANAILGCLAVVAFAACSGSTAAVGGGSDSGATDAGAGEAGTSDGPGGITADQAASDAVAAYCQRAEACAPAYVTFAFGDRATCAARLKLVAADELAAAGTSQTPAQMEACAQALPQVSCSDLLSRRSPDACKPKPGQIADGSACADDAQCAGARCKVPAGAVCGTCGSRAAAGGACAADDDCDYGMKCVSSACAAYVDDGGACDATHPCRADLACTSGACGAPGPVGTSCKASSECDQLHGDFCNGASGHCEAATFVSPGQTCGLVNNGIVACKGPGSLCVGATAPKYQGLCAAPAADGAACDAASGNGPLCNAVAVCVSGTCTVPDASRCK